MYNEVREKRLQVLSRENLEQQMNTEDPGKKFTVRVV